jgi:hypothetical protein
MQLGIYYFVRRTDNEEAPYYDGNTWVQDIQRVKLFSEEKSAVLRVSMHSRNGIPCEVFSVLCDVSIRPDSLADFLSNPEGSKIKTKP